MRLQVGSSIYRLAKDLDAIDREHSQIVQCGQAQQTEKASPISGIDPEKISIVNVNTATAKPKSGSNGWGCFWALLIGVI